MKRSLQPSSLRSVVRHPACAPTNEPVARRWAHWRARSCSARSGRLPALRSAIPRVAASPIRGHRSNGAVASGKAPKDPRKTAADAVPLPKPKPATVGREPSRPRHGPRGRRRARSLRTRQAHDPQRRRRGIAATGLAANAGAFEFPRPFPDYRREDPGTLGSPRARGTRSLHRARRSGDDRSRRSHLAGDAAILHLMHRGKRHHDFKQRRVGRGSRHQTLCRVSIHKNTHIHHTADQDGPTSSGIPGGRRRLTSSGS